MCDIGPLQCFVSKNNIPTDMEFDSNASSPCFKTKDEEVVIQRNDDIRLRIIGLRVDASDIVR
jgi:DNA-directed RNA polymerase subunit E'/Rpb7